MYPSPAYRARGPEAVEDRHVAVHQDLGRGLGLGLGLGLGWGLELELGLGLLQLAVGDRKRVDAQVLSHQLE